MKKIMLLLSALAGIVGCTRNQQEIPFTELSNYFVRNDIDQLPATPKIDSQEDFQELFGMAAVMGKNGQPTAIDFENEFVIAVICPQTDTYTTLKPICLKNEGGHLVLHYDLITGEKVGWYMQPLLLVKVDRKYETAQVEVKASQNNVAQVIYPQSNNPENMKRVCEFLHKTGYYFLATVDGDQPQVRPFGTAEIIDGRLYIQTGHVKKVAHQIAVNPKVAICAYDTASGEWLRICSTLVEDPRIEVKKAMLDANPSLRSMYNEADGNTAVYYLKDAKAMISSFTADPVEIDF